MADLSEAFRQRWSNQAVIASQYRPQNSSRKQRCQNLPCMAQRVGSRITSDLDKL